MKQIALLIGLVFLTSGCQAVMEKWQKARILDHLKDLKSYHGVMSERGLTEAGDAIETEFWYQAPNRYELVTRSPSRYTGTTLYFNGETLIVYYPQTKFAIVTSGFSPLADSAAGDLVSAGFDNNVRNLDYTLGPTSKVLGYPVTELDFKARTSTSIVRKGSSLVYDKFSFPLATDLEFVGGAKYGLKVQSIEFNGSETLPNFALPKDIVKSEWDLKSAPKTKEEARRELGADFRLPSPKSLETPLGPLALTKIIRQKGPVPAFAALYDQPPLGLSVMAFRDYGVSLVPVGRGLKVPVGAIKAELFPGPHLSLLTFKVRGLQYVLQGNVPLEVLMAVATEMARVG